MNSRLQNLIGQVLEKYSQRKGRVLPKELDYEINVTRDPSHGDLASNVAFKLARHFQERPNLIADELVLLLEEEDTKKSSSHFIDRVEVAGGGFINFYLAKASLAEVLLEIHKKGREFGKSNFGSSKKVILEFVSANPTGPLTIAHGRQAAVGDAMARILKTTGHQVTTEYYLNDAGRQMNLLGASLWARYRQECGEKADIPEEGYQGEYLIELARQLKKSKKDSLLKEPEDKAVDFCRQFAGTEIMKGIERDLDQTRVHFDHYFKESALYEKKAVNHALNYLTDHHHIYEKDGALWFRSTVFGDDKDRVVKKSTGDYTYLAPDIAYHRYKFERGFNWLINLWGPDHHGYVARLKAACQALGHPPSEMDVRIVQLTTLFRAGKPVRMSTRAGEFVTLRELYEEVGVDATRFFFVMRKIESHLDFDLELAKQKSQDNPVYYLQYAHARIASLLKFSEIEVTTKVNLERLDSEEENTLIKMISEYPEVLIQSSEMLEPYRLVDYLRDVAASFHKFYSHHRVVTEDKELSAARLLLADATRIILQNGLDLLGISQPDSM
ncbi:MAG: arginine--tRNA ligase [Candidatus Omnitrophica bacterium]|nr:arginine--tRNA ligase [Candidatus Omnitrophota bacterium]